MLHYIMVNAMTAAKMPTVRKESAHAKKDLLVMGSSAKVIDFGHFAATLLICSLSRWRNNKYVMLSTRFV